MTATHLPIPRYLYVAACYSERDASAYLSWPFTLSAPTMALLRPSC